MGEIGRLKLDAGNEKLVGALCHLLSSIVSENSDNKANKLVSDVINRATIIGHSLKSVRERQHFVSVSNYISSFFYCVICIKKIHPSKRAWWPSGLRRLQVTDES